jgi:coniferyl-aldehyde dehydrogenase
MSMSAEVTPSAPPDASGRSDIERPAVEDAGAVDLPALLQRMQDAQTREGSPNLKERLRRLDRLERALLDHESAIASAMREDFGSKSKAEVRISEIYLVVNGIRHAKAHVREWMEPEAREVPWPMLPADAEVIPQPVGVVGIVSPWNYPINLALLPLVGALAAGNRAILKPSEIVPRTSRILADLVRVAFEPDVVTVVVGDASVGEAFTKLPFDHLVFTGSTRVGHAVMRAASDHLVPVTLELGGKSPVLLGPDADLREAATRVMAGKIWNAGQTCVAPDYLLAPKARFEPFVAEAQKALARMLPRLADNPDYTSIVSDRHYARLDALVNDARDKGALIQPLNPAGEALAPETRRFVPTLVVGATESMQIMQEEIFGPLLPIVAAESLDDAIAFVNARPRPLALYYFGRKTPDIDRVLDRTRSGGVTVNDTLLHGAVDELPFGGIGASGMGAYHGREGFETFTKRRAVFYQSRVTGRRLLSPPFGRALDVLLKVLLSR